MVINANEDGIAVVGQDGTISLALGAAADKLEGWSSLEGDIDRPPLVAVGNAMFKWCLDAKDYVFAGFSAVE